MKRFLGFLLMAIVCIMPNLVSAARIDHVCSEPDANDIVTCSVNYIIDESAPQDKVTVTLTEKGGATIDKDSIKGVSDSEFSLSGTPTYASNVYTVELLTPSPVSGEVGLFNFSYKKSGSTDCKVVIGIGQNKVETPSEGTTDNVQTGATLPIVALSAIAIIAGAAYISTKNKSKMYKI